MLLRTGLVRTPINFCMKLIGEKYSPVNNLIVEAFNNILLSYFKIIKRLRVVIDYTIKYSFFKVFFLNGKIVYINKFKVFPIFTLFSFKFEEHYFGTNIFTRTARSFRLPFVYGIPFFPSSEQQGPQGERQSLFLLLYDNPPEESTPFYFFAKTTVKAISWSAGNWVSTSRLIRTCAPEAGSCLS